MLSKKYLKHLLIPNIDRGGLFHISDDAFNFFKVMELCIQKYLAQHLTSSSTTDRKESLFKNITDDNNVQSYWHTLTIDVSDLNDADELLNRITDTWRLKWLQRRILQKVKA